jgi:hypothetical protein
MISPDDLKQIMSATEALAGVVMDIAVNKTKNKNNVSIDQVTKIIAGNDYFSTPLRYKLVELYHARTIYIITLIKKLNIKNDTIETADQLLENTMDDLINNNKMTNKFLTSYNSSDFSKEFQRLFIESFAAQLQSLLPKQKLDDSSDDDEEVGEIKWRYTSKSPPSGSQTTVPFFQRPESIGQAQASPNTPHLYAKEKVTGQGPYIYYGDSDDDVEDIVFPQKAKKAPLAPKPLKVHIDNKPLKVAVTMPFYTKENTKKTSDASTQTNPVLIISL